MAEKNALLPKERGVGLLSRANEFVQAGDKLKSGLASAVPPAPLYFLYCHGIELGLKAFLISQGVTDRLLRDIGHDLTCALCAARAHPSFPSPSRKDLQLLRWVDTYYKSKDFEYLFPGAKQYPLPDDLGAVAQRLLTSLKPVIRKAVQTHLAHGKAAG